MSYSDCDGCITSFKYNADGIRISKNYINYLLDGTKIIEESDGVRTIKYLYGEGGVIGFNYNGTIYYYRKNLQGDVIEIYYEDTRLAATYTYDAWGKILEVNDYTNENIAQLNPFRYRSYYYDVETGLYYLNSRYYDPETGRFLNADSLEYLDPENVMGLNLYAYCANNPINRFDDTGNWSLPNWAKVTIGAVAIAGLAVATVCTGGAAAVICGAALSGAIAGGASGAVMGAIGGGISGGWQGALDGACSGFMSGTLIGGVTGAASAGLNIATGATTVVGNAHGSTLHKLATNMEAGKMAASGQYSQIGVNKALKTMGLNGTSRPDVIGVAKNGMNKIVEVVSPRQSTNYIINKMSNMLSNNPGSVGKIVNWVRRLFK